MSSELKVMVNEKPDVLMNLQLFAYRLSIE